MDLVKASLHLVIDILQGDYETHWLGLLNRHNRHAILIRMAAAGETGTGTALARRIAYTANRRGQVPGEGHPAVWKPWAEVIKEASARLRVELTDGLRRLEAENAAAGQLLDTAAGLADESVRHITEAAWAAWHRQMDAAQTTAEAILAPARSAYDQETARAEQRYSAAVESAKRTFERTLAKAREAEGLGDQMTRGVA